MKMIYNDDQLRTTYPAQIVSFAQLIEIERLLREYDPAPITFEIEGCRDSYPTIQELANVWHQREFKQLNIIQQPHRTIANATARRASVFIRIDRDETTISVSDADLSACGIFYALCRVLDTNRRWFGKLLGHSSVKVSITSLFFAGVAASGTLSAANKASAENPTKEDLIVFGIMMGVLLIYIALGWFIRGGAQLSEGHKPFIVRHRDDLIKIIITVLLTLIGTAVYDQAIK